MEEINYKNVLIETEKQFNYLYKDIKVEVQFAMDKATALILKNDMIIKNSGFLTHEECCAFISDIERFLNALGFDYEEED